MATLAREERQRFAFRDFVLDPAEATLTCSGEVVPLAPKELEVLRVLVCNAGHLVHKEELIRRVWPDTFVSDSSLLRNISVVRKHVGRDCIRTVPKRGYTFVLPVLILQESDRIAGSALVDERWPLPGCDPEGKAGTVNGDDSPHCLPSGYRDAVSPAIAGPEQEHAKPGRISSFLAATRRAWRQPMAAAAVFMVLVGGTEMEWPHLHNAVTSEQNLAPSTLQSADRADVESARLYDLAWFYRNKATASDLVKSIELFRQATQADPNNPRAWAGLADALYSTLGTAELRTEHDAAADEADLATQRSIDLGPGFPEPHLAAGTMNWQHGNLQAAEAEYRRALRLNPIYGEAQYHLAALLSETGRLAEAKAEYDRALELEPSSVRVVANAATLYSRLGLDGEALHLLHTALDMNDESVLIYGDLGQVLARMHRYSEAAAAYHKASQLSGTLIPYGAPEAFCLGRLGRLREAQSIRSEILRLQQASNPGISPALPEQRTQAAK